MAQRDAISENEAALKLMRKGAGLDERVPAKGKIGNALDEFIGTWTKEEAAEINEAIKELRTVDRSIWQRTELDQRQDGQ